MRQQEVNEGDRKKLTTTYKEKQAEIENQITIERTMSIEKRLNKIIANNSKNSLWKEKKNMTKNTVLESLTIKDEKGEKLFDQELVKGHTAQYYENL